MTDWSLWIIYSIPVLVAWVPQRKPRTRDIALSVYCWIIAGFLGVTSWHDYALLQHETLCYHALHEASLLTSLQWGMFEAACIALLPLIWLYQHWHKQHKISAPKTAA